MSLILDINYSARALFAAKTRTALTMLGIIIGVMSVVAISSVGRSAQDFIINRVESVGTNIVGVLSGGSSQDNGPPPIAFGIITTSLKNGDYAALRALPHVIAGNALVPATASVSYASNSQILTIMGGTEEQPHMEDAAIAAGRYFNFTEVESYSRVAVLGWGAAQKISPHGSPLGQQIRIKGYGFIVIGIMAKRGSSGFGDTDDEIFIPYTTSEKLVAGVEHLTGIRLQVDDALSIAGVKQQVAATLRRRHHITDPKKDDFTVRSSDQAIGIITGVTDAVNAFLVLVTAISLLVGGINIMNIMYVAVRERTREIGLRKALGAKPKRISRQFLVESALIAFTGGLIGLILGAIIAYLVSLAAVAYGFKWGFTLSPTAIVISLVVSIGIGLIFGVAPASAAARLDAIESLRYE